jgi:hypothetical protein
MVENRAQTPEGFCRRAVVAHILMIAAAAVIGELALALLAGNILGHASGPDYSVEKIISGRSQPEVQDISRKPQF